MSPLINIPSIPILGGEELGSEQFMAEFWSGELYFDLDRSWWDRARVGLK